MFRAILFVIKAKSALITHIPRFCKCLTNDFFTKNILRSIRGAIAGNGRSFCLLENTKFRDFLFKYLKKRNISYFFKISFGMITSK